MPHQLFHSPLPMAPAAASVNTSSKDPTKMSKAELLHLLKTTAAKKEKLDKKCGQYLHLHCWGACWALIPLHRWYFHDSKGPEEVQTHEEGPQCQPTPQWIDSKGTHPLSTRQTHSQGSYNVADNLFEKSGVTKEGYNTFVVHSSTLCDCHSLIYSCLIPIDISPSNDCSHWNPDDSYLVSHLGRPSCWGPGCCETSVVSCDTLPNYWPRFQSASQEVPLAWGIWRRLASNNNDEAISQE